MKLTNNQRDYLLSRLHQRVLAIRISVTERETIPAVILTVPEMVKLVEEGKVKKIKYDKSKYHATNITTLWDFSKFQSGKHLSKKGEKTLKKLESTYQSIKDTIMLGDSETDALALLSKLDTGKW